MKTSKQHQKFWENRKVDWVNDYLSTVDHPHRDLIIQALHAYRWSSVLEVGCASGPNLVKILKHFPQADVGGIDVNRDAILTANQVLPPRALLDIRPAHDLFMSDKSTDITLTDACLMYIGRSKIHKTIKEIKRITRKHVIFCELHSTSRIERFGAYVLKGYNVHNYEKLLDKHGFYDIRIYKIPPQMWPGIPWERWGHIITANL